MRNVSDKFVEKMKAHILCSNFCLGNRVLDEVMWKNMEQLDTPQTTTQHGACALHAG
jgi:hypothetical protein